MNIFVAIGTVALLVFIHEFGHFIVAKACGVHVKVFSIGFGRRVVGFEHNGTDYRFSAVPFGGYVQMAGADPFGTGEEDDDWLDDPARAFLRRPIWQRLLVVSAGPAFNLLLPLVVFTGLLMAGEPQPSNQLGTVERDGLAAAAGVRVGDNIVAVDGQPTDTWNAVAKQLSEWESGPHTVTVKRDGVTRVIDIPYDADGLVGIGLSFYRPSSEAGVDDPNSPAGVAGVVTGDRIARLNGLEISDWLDVDRALYDAGPKVALTLEDGRALELQASDWRPVDAALAVSPSAKWGLTPTTIFVGDVGETVERDSTDLFAGCRPTVTSSVGPAFEAGLREGDRFLRLDGQLVRGWSDVLSGVAATMDGEGEGATARSVRIEVVRAGTIVDIELQPQVIRDTNRFGTYYYRPILGVMRMGSLADGPQTRVYYGFDAAWSRAWFETTRIGGLIVEQVGKLFTGDAAMQRTLGGPVEMVRQASSAAEQGLFVWARFMGMLSISLGIINLLPIPVLDGGQLVFYAMEGLRGRPLSLAVREKAQQIGVLFLVMVMMSVLFFDLRRWLFE
ncbi:MAG: RIP metalloprotease RseP [Myxococcota bacterium]|nr:RIP metalloprotease RseP [Myxococcota bacterium]MEC9389465.1 RIP metalloprotease RseP [Myxococcota bacterium]